MDEKKVKEAIEYLKSLIYVRKRTLEALEKQLPKKVEIEAWSPSYCPSCGYELSEDLGDGYYKHPKIIKRCPNPDCAQLLDWSE